MIPLDDRIRQNLKNFELNPTKSHDFLLMFKCLLIPRLSVLVKRHNEPVGVIKFTKILLSNMNYILLLLFAFIIALAIDRARKIAVEAEIQMGF